MNCHTPSTRELRDHNDVFAGMFGRFGYSFHIGHAGRTERVAGEIVSGTYFPVLGVGAALGRTLTPEDDRLPGGHPVAVISHGFWVSGFASDPGVINSSLVINGHPYTVVGVAQPGFDGIEVGRPARVFVPMMMKAQLTPGWNALDERLYRWVSVFARLRPGVTAGQAQAGLSPYFTSLVRRRSEGSRFRAGGTRDASALRSEHPAGDSVVAGPIRAPPDADHAALGADGDRRRRSPDRLRQRRQPAPRARRGAAARDRGTAGARCDARADRGPAAGRKPAARARWRCRRCRDCRHRRAGSCLGFFVSPDAPAPISTSPDWRILAFTFAISTLTGILFGMAPAIQSTRPDVAPTLKDQAGSVLGGHARLRKGLVASQIAISLLLVIGAALFTRTLGNLLAVDIGFDSSRVISFGVDPTLNGYDRTAHAAVHQGAAGEAERHRRRGVGGNRLDADSRGQPVDDVDHRRGIPGQDERELLAVGELDQPGLLRDDGHPAAGRA